jgi:hypothetical protein
MGNPAELIFRNARTVSPRLAYIVSRKRFAARAQGAVLERFQKNNLAAPSVAALFATGRLRHIGRLGPGGAHDARGTRRERAESSFVAAGQMARRGGQIEMNLHPITRLFPPLPPADFEALKADIAANGIQLPVITYKGEILDGANRWRACQELGAKCPTKEWDGKHPWMLAQAMNLRRRHLRQDQIASIYMLAAQRIPEVRQQIEQAKQEAEQRQREGRRQGGRGKKKTRGPHGPEVSRARDALASVVGVSGRTWSRVEHVAAKAPEKLKAIDKGEITATEACRQIKRAEVAN